MRNVPTTQSFIAFALIRKMRSVAVFCKMFLNHEQWTVNSAMMAQLRQSVQSTSNIFIEANGL